MATTEQREGEDRCQAAMFKRMSAVAVLLVTVSTESFAQSSLKGTGTLEKVVKEMTARQKKVKTLQADFRQEKELALLAKPEVSTGTFVYAKPSSVVWRYSTPKPVIMQIANGWMTTYYPSLKKAEKLEVGKYQDRIFRYMAASGAVDELARYFDFTFVESKNSPFYRLELKPKTKVVARRVKGIKIWIDTKTYMTTKFEYIEGDGDLTRYEFTNLRVNAPLAANAFELKLPADVKVEHIKVGK